MMLESQYVVLGISYKVDRTFTSDDQTEVITLYKPNKLFEKWMDSEINLAIIEQSFRQIVGDPPNLTDLKEIIFQHLYKEEVFRSSVYRDVYYEIKQVIKYAVNSIVIDADEAKLLIESGMVKVVYQDFKLRITTILNEREVNGFI